jgi:hypothetical protein
MLPDVRTRKMEHRLPASRMVAEGDSIYARFLCPAMEKTGCRTALL